ncbi:MAG: sigma-54-dependent Fis family transcriptional regulator [Oligoflexales bacterium]|nr:sigma-54-dependent Fis family transcriptional regulator [Oligoflexales bacterium]
MAGKLNLLIVEDDGEQLSRYLEYGRQLNLNVSGLQNLNDAMTYFSIKAVDVLITDIHLCSDVNQSTFEGFKLIEHVRDNYPETKIIAMSSDPKLETYQRSLHLGALFFLKKPIISPDELAIAIEGSKKLKLLKNMVDSMQSAPSVQGQIAKLCPDGLVFGDYERKRAQKLALNRKIAILIMGETGTGKEEFAKLIYRNRCQLEGPIPFIAVNCANLDPSLAVSTLFGHVKGSFTGADKTSNGYVGEADGGILFLDEIHTLGIDMQRRLLRVLNDGSYNRLGDTRILQSDFQLICASTCDLEHEVQEGRFLLDLLMRITGINIKLSPLRERLQDIPVFVALFLANEGVKVEADEFDRIVDKCSKYYWQGNIRQLQKAISIMVLNASLDDSTIRADFLPVMQSMLAPHGKDDLQASVQRILGINGVPADALDNLLKTLTADTDFYGAVEYYERLMIQAAISRHDKLIQVASALKIPRSTLDEKRKRYGL